ncbi:MAG: hypothetical protein SGJ19_13450 [Planctomycetia bacterium]|nr:hypothetical protein [Planctomycetia bacterium]
MPPERLIRRLPSHRIADFDDFLWPVNAALVVFGLCVAGVVVAESDFHTPVLVYNGWVRLGSLLAVMGAMVWGMMRLDRHWSRRMQLSVLVALITHLWAAVYLHEQFLEMALLANEAAVNEPLEEMPLVTLPDYDFQELDQTVPDETLDDPLETVVPDMLPPELVKEELPSQPTEIRENLEQARIEIENPQPAPLVRAETAAPRRSESYSAGPLSRQERQQDFSPELIETPSLVATPVQPATELEADSVSVLRQAAAPERTERQTDNPPLNARRAPNSELTRRENDAAPEDSTSQSTASRQRQMASIDAPDDAQEVLEALRSPTASRSLAPSVVVAERTQNAAPAERSANTGSEAPAATPSPSPWRGARSNDTPALSGEHARIAARSGRTPGLPNERISQPTLGRPGESARGENALTPEVGELTRSAATGGASPGRPNTPHGATGALTANAATSSATAANNGQAPRVATQSASALNRNPTAAPRNVDVASIDVASPQSRAVGGSNAALEPTNTGVTRNSGGATGITRQNQFDADLPGVGSPSNTASAAARRASPTDEAPNGQGDRPSRPSQLARARAGSELPSAALRADDVTIADSAGAERPGDIEASSSAAVTRRASNSPTGRATAAAGGSSIDLDPGPINSAAGAGRTSGGGEPTISSSYQPSTARRGQASAEIGDVAAITESSSAAESGASGGANGASGTLNPSNSGVARGESGGAPARRGDGGSVAGLQPALGGGGGANELSRANGGGEQGPAIANASGVPGGRATSSPLAGDDGADDPLAGGGASGGTSTAAAGGGGAGPTGDGVTGVTRSTSSGGAQRPATGGVGVGVTATGGAPANGRARGNAGSGPTVTADGPSTAPRGRRTASANVDDDDAEMTDVKAVATNDGGAQGAPDAESIGPTAAAMAAPKQSSTALVRHEAAPGVGGLGGAAKLAPGVPNRRARPDSEVAHNSIQRFVLERSGGTAAPIDAKADTGPVQGFKQRNPNRRGELAEALGGNSASERAVEMGLDFLARHQLEDGRWSLHDLAGGKAGYQNNGAGSMKSDTAATGLALLTFYGAGYTHSDGKYRLVVRRGLDQLLTSQEANGCLFIPQDVESAKNVRFYSHGIAAIALCEAYGMTRDKDLREPAQKALDYIVASQHPNEGGWRYSPGGGSDTSVTGWQMMAMKSGELAGLKVPPQTYDGLRDWLEHAATPWGTPARYAYRPRSTEQNQAQPSLAMTAEGLLMQQYLGWQRDNPYLRDGAEYLKANLPKLGTPTLRTRDCYYWYYATQVMFQMQGEYWTSWNEALRPLLIDNQVQEGQFAGSWEPTGPTPDRWGPHGGRLYVTCMHLLMLEVYYRHLPLYRDLNVAQAQP